jgi:hypothetical protein
MSIIRAMRLVRKTKFVAVVALVAVVAIVADVFNARSQKAVTLRRFLTFLIWFYMVTTLLVGNRTILDRKDGTFRAIVSLN